MTDTPIHERLARAALISWHGDEWKWDDLDEDEQGWLLGMVDAILAALQEPTVGMKCARNRNSAYWREEDAETWRAMIQHIRDGGS